MTDEALHRILLDQLRDLNRRSDEDRAQKEVRHQQMLTELVTIRERQEAFARRHAECEAWRTKHAVAHGLDPVATPSPWVANCTSWAWHHPKRTLVGLLVLVAILISDMRHWLVAKATWAFSLWLAG